MSASNDAKPTVSAASGPASPRGRSRRKPALIALTLTLIGAAIGVWLWWAMVEKRFERTDNAYVHAPLVQVTPQVAGTVIAVLAEDTEAVGAGQILVRLDPADARIALARAEAGLAQTVREVQSLFLNNSALAAQVRLRDAELARAHTEVMRSADNLSRRQPLVASGAIGTEEIGHAEAALAAARSAQAAAQSALAAAQEQAASNRALTEGTTVGRHPSVERAAVAVREAWLALKRSELPAPVAGQVARRSVQVGQRVAAGQTLMTVIPLDQVWVEANFKESQLERLRIGQIVTLRADLYGSSTEFTGRIAGLAAGTGSAFALLPTQNASGNWIKIVQRVPVRIELDAAAIQAHPLRVGLSMQVSVDVSQQEGLRVTEAPAPRTARHTEAFVSDLTQINLRIAEIIAASLGGQAPGKPPAGSGRR